MLNIAGLKLPMVGSEVATGDVYFLGSAHANANDNPGNGKRPDRPFATLDYALSKMTSGQGDILYGMPGHSETITGVGGITFDKAAIKFIGLGTYYYKPTFLMDGADTVTCLVTEPDVVMSNLTFKAGHADIAVWGHIAAKGCVIDSCRFVENTTDENWVDCIHAGTADNDYDGLVLSNNEIIMDDAACVTAIDLLKDCNDVKIVNNRITGDFDATPFAPIYMATAEVAKNILIQYNKIHNLHNADAVVGISMDCITATGWIVDNDISHQDVAGETPILAGAAGLYVARNFCSGVPATASGYVYPAIDS